MCPAMSEVKHRIGSIDAALTPRRPSFRAGSGLSAERMWARSYRNRLRLTDTVIVLVTVAVALLTRFGSDPSDGRGPEFAALYATISLLIVATWMLSLWAYRTRDHRITGVGVSEYRRVAAASVFTFGLLAILFVIVKIEVARGFFMLALPVGLAGLMTSRWLWRRWLTAQRERGHYLSRALVAGSREDVSYVVDRINASSGAMYNVLGAAVDTQQADAPRTDALPCGGGKVPVVADLTTIGMAAANLEVDTVIVAGHPSDDTAFIRDLSWQLEGTATELVLASKLTDVAGPRIHFRPVEGLPLIHVEIPQFEGGKHVLKRLFDVVVSGTALLLLSPLLLVIALVVHFDSPGGVIFTQERVGRNSRTFRMRKFRSMVATAESDRTGLVEQNQGAGVLFKMKNDPRVTRAGRMLRKYSLDELPQLWNVFVGDMSLVGPRPPLPSEVLGYEKHVHRRLYIKPGLTGLWQVNGRSDLSWDESVRLDLYYVENWSLIGDLMLIWRTFKVVLRPVGAY
jgi:exopolysaccharide biosynthesis polyprenyl glycosylphosphotransferase